MRLDLCWRGMCVYGSEYQSIVQKHTFIDIQISVKVFFLHVLINVIKLTSVVTIVIFIGYETVT